MRLLLFSLLLFAASCGTSSSSSATKPATKPESAPAAASRSGNDSAVLPGTGLSQERAKALLALAGGDRPEPPKGCQWVVQETAFVDDYLLYLAAKCANGKVTALEYAGGAHKAELTIAASAVNGDALKGRKVAEVYSFDEKDPHLSILNAAREAIKKPAEAAKCRVVPLKAKGYPADALVVDVSAAEAAKAPKDEPRTACGPYGLDEDSQTYWRNFQGFSWFFELGQDEVEFDPGSLTLVHKDEKGNWGRSE